MTQRCWHCGSIAALHGHGNIPLQSWMMSFHKQGELSEPPPLTQHATVQEHEIKVILTGTGMILPKPKPCECMAQLQQHPFYWEWQWELTITGNLPNLVESLLVDDGYAVSNSSFQTGRGAAAWIIEGRDNTNQRIRTCLSTSNKDRHSSFQSELAEIFAILLTLQILLLPTLGEKPSK